MRELNVQKNDAGQRLDRFVGKAVPLLPESLLQKYIRLKRIKVNQARAARDLRLAEGDRVQLYISDEFFQPLREETSYLKIGKPRLDLLYEDENLLLADKKPGVLCHSAGKWDYNTLIANIQAHLWQTGEWRPREENAFAAKNAETLRILNEKLRDREIEKRYLCLVHGRPRPPEGRLEGYLFKDAKKNQVYVKDSPVPGARTAVTDYRLLRSRGGLSLVECTLHTGRTHQIRAQMAHAGWPLLGDGKYGSQRKDRPYAEEGGQALYSWYLCFRFPTDAGRLNYLRGREFRVEKVDFIDKYFPEAAGDAAYNRPG